MPTTQIHPWNNESLAPNGCPVRDNFANWFQGSKICDGQGSPLIVYRGDKEPVDSFDPNKRREPGQFFCMEPERAAFYGDPCAYVLHAENVLDLREVYVQWRKGGPVTDIVDSLHADYYEGNQDPESGEDYSVSDVITAIEEGYLWRTDGLGGWKMDAWRDLQRIALQDGFDAILVHDDGEGVGKGLDVVIFGANQVKSLNQNSGLFLRDSLSVSDQKQALDIERAVKAEEIVREQRLRSVHR